MKCRAMIAVIGDAGIAPETEAYAAARDVGRLAVDHGFRIATGGLSGVMEAACRGAHESANYREGDTLGMIPQDDPRHANPWVDIVIATGLGHARNALVASADAVVAIGGGAGTLTEIAFAWTYRRLIVTLPFSGWATELGGRPLDQRRRYPDMPDDRIMAAATPAEALAIIVERLPLYTAWGRQFRSGVIDVG